jgi:hypothetical protein
LATPPERMICAHGLTYTYCFSRHFYSAIWPPLDWLMPWPFTSAGIAEQRMIMLIRA